MWLFAIFYGFTFSVGIESQGADIVAYMSDIPKLNYLNLDLNGILVYYASSNEADILRTLLAFLVSKFTANGFYLVIVYSIIYGYFFSRNMWYVLDRLKGNTKFFTKILLFTLFLAIPLWNMNGFRFWTAAHVFIYGLLPFVFEQNRRSLIWCFVTPFVIHFSFLIILIPLVLYLVLGNKIKLYYVFFIVTLFFSEFNISQFNDVVNTYAPQQMAERARVYTGEEKVAELREEGRLNQHQAWHANYYGLGVKIPLMVFLIMIYWSNKKTIYKDEYLLRLLSFVLLFYGFANLLNTIPSGGRFTSIANLLTLSFMTLYFQNNIIKKNLLLYSRLATPFLLFFIVVALRLSWNSFSVMTVIGNPITAIFTFGENISLNDIIKGL